LQASPVRQHGSLVHRNHHPRRRIRSRGVPRGASAADPFMCESNCITTWLIRDQVTSFHSGLIPEAHSHPTIEAHSHILRCFKRRHPLDPW